MMIVYMNKWFVEAFVIICVVSFFFFQAEDGIRDIGVTGVQTCALPILHLLFQEFYWCYFVFLFIIFFCLRLFSELICVYWYRIKFHTGISSFRYHTSGCICLHNTSKTFIPEWVIPDWTQPSLAPDRSFRSGIKLDGNSLQYHLKTARVRTHRYKNRPFSNW